VKNLSDWPALSYASAWPEKLKFSRAVWGKVHGASSDYRWIALSAGLAPEPDLHKEFVAGVEDLQEKALLWRSLGGRSHAVTCYPSRAADKSGRADFLEKQVLSWDRCDLPAALGALILLSYATGLDDSLWWSRYEDKPWSEPDFALPIDPSDHEPRPVRIQDLAATVEQGLAEIRSALGIERLQALYAAILAGSKPAFLTGLQEPLSAAALAALLLPLPREHADRLSVAGWLPSRRAFMDELKKLWDVIVLPPDLTWLAANAPEIDPRFQAEGRRLAGALLGQEAVSYPLADLPPRPIEPLPEPVPTPEKPGLPGRPIPGHTITLASPSPRAPEVLRKLRDFAAATDRRWLEAESLLSMKPGLIDHRDSPIPGWISALADQRPAWADPEQWKVKLDLLRCAALILHPHPYSAMPESGKVPPLYFISAVPTADLNGLKRLGNLLQQALDQSLSLGQNPRTKQMRKVLQIWRG
jgi:hypothetical protein